MATDNLSVRLAGTTKLIQVTTLPPTCSLQHHPSRRPSRDPEALPVHCCRATKVPALISVEGRVESGGGSVSAVGQGMGDLGHGDGLAPLVLDLELYERFGVKHPVNLNVCNLEE